MSELSIPTNIKQVGEIPDGIQIYLEDYVYTIYISMLERIQKARG